MLWLVAVLPVQFLISGKFRLHFNSAEDSCQMTRTWKFLTFNLTSSKKTCDLTLNVSDLGLDLDSVTWEKLDRFILKPNFNLCAVTVNVYSRLVESPTVPQQANRIL